MRVMLVNPPYQTLTSNLGVGHQVPLGLLMVGGALQAAGHVVRLVDAEAEHLSANAVGKQAKAWQAEVVMTGHAGSTPAHPACMQTLAAVKRARPTVTSVYGGVYPTYDAERILRDEPAVDVIIRGEGEATAPALVDAIEAGRPLDDVAGLAYRCDGADVVRTARRPPIADLDAVPTGWNLIDDWDRYGCFGRGRAAVVQFSRGCPHRCTYCGQHAFWVSWRHRDPVRFVDELAYLHREHGVRFVTLADENPTTRQATWRAVLEELAARKLDLHLFATIRADDLVRDADLLPLYRRAGILYVLMGIETTDPEVIQRVRKGSTTTTDAQACRLLRENGIFSIIGHIVGLGDESWSKLRQAKRALAAYDGDYLNAMYVTPHRWTAFAHQQRERRVIDVEPSHWDYRHQLLGERRMSRAGLFVGVKLLELWFHLRPQRLRRLLLTRDRFRRRQLWWTQLHVGMVWLGEIVAFMRDSVRRREQRHRGAGRTLGEWLQLENGAATRGQSAPGMTPLTGAPASER